MNNRVVLEVELELGSTDRRIASSLGRSISRLSVEFSSIFSLGIFLGFHSSSSCSSSSLTNRHSVGGVPTSSSYVSFGIVSRTLLETSFRRYHQQLTESRLRFVARAHARRDATESIGRPDHVVVN